METQSHNNEEHGPEVEITVNNEHPHVHRGRQTVAAIKVAGKVPLADDLVQVINNKPETLADDASVTIKGGEHFISHPKGAGSS